MFRKDPLDERLDETIDNLLSEMAGLDGDSEAYAKAVDQVTKLYDIRKGNRISKETWMTVGAHLAGIVIIVGHERANVITSKAVTFLGKLL